MASSDEASQNTAEDPFDDRLHKSVISFINAHRTRNPDQLRAILADDLVLTDHRPAGFGSNLGIDEYLEMQMSSLELTPNRKIVSAEKLFGLADPTSTRDAVEVARLRATGTDEFGNPVEWAYLAVWVISDGRVRRLDVYPADSVDEAVECARALMGQ